MNLLDWMGLKENTLIPHRQRNIRLGIMFNDFDAGKFWLQGLISSGTF